VQPALNNTLLSQILSGIVLHVHSNHGQSICDASLPSVLDNDWWQGNERMDRSSCMAWVKMPDETTWHTSKETQASPISSLSLTHTN